MIKPDYIPFIEDLIELSIKEDIGDGDHATLSSIPKDEIGKMHLLIKQNGVVSGIEIARMIFTKLDPEVTFTQLIQDGELVKIGDIAFTVKGKLHSLLQAERIILNIMQRMSGVATQTANYVKEIEGTSAKLLDTRKTNPGMRVLDKIAVKTGGGVNHRTGLYDLILLKDNHIDFAGGVAQALNGAKEYLKKNSKSLQIEIEVRSMDDIIEVLNTGGADRIMLDNFDTKKTKEAVEFINGRVQVESSGGITLDTIRSYALCGVDFISVGALTHQIKSLDMSLKAIKE